MRKNELLSGQKSNLLFVRNIKRWAWRRRVCHAGEKRASAVPIKPSTLAYKSFHASRKSDQLSVRTARKSGELEGWTY